MTEQYKSLNEFYVFYLSEHKNEISRKLHFTGTALFFILFFVALFLSKYWIFWLLPLVGYGFAWAGHYFFEKNKPATFKYPVYSLLSDFRLFFELLSGKQKFKQS